MRFMEVLSGLMGGRKKVSVYIIAEVESRIVGIISKIGEDFIEIKGKHGTAIVQADKIGYIRICNPENSEEISE